MPTRFPQTIPAETCETEDYGFEIIQQGNRSWATDRPMIGLRKGNMIGLNQLAYQAIGGAGYVAIVYSARHHILGLRRTEKGTPGARCLRTYDPNNTVALHGGKALERPDIASARLGQYEARWYGDVLGIVLEDAAREG